MGHGSTIDPDLIRRMNAAIAHRGPDDQGVWVDRDAGIALGHRRLAIVDLSPMGHQPMLSSSGRFVIAFNGEVYNHLELRSALEQDGTAPVWRGHSDTETLLACIEAWGLAITLKRSVGMFAIALWDRDHRVLRLARDRLGEKPLYFGWQGRGERRCLLFGSDLRAFEQHPCFEAKIDPAAVGLLLQHNYIAAPYSIYQGIRKLEPASILEIDAGSGRQVASIYWDLGAVAQHGQSHPFAGTPDEAVDRVQELACLAIAGQRVADVPIGAFLSGGVDSSTVVALMQAQSSRPVRTFTIGFQEEGYNEAEHALAVAKHLGTEHTELYVTPAEARSVIPMLPTWYSEPFADASQIPTYIVSRLARQHVTVSLSGDGGDELFAGYSRYAQAMERWQRLQRTPAPLRNAAARMLRIARHAAEPASTSLALRLRRAAPILASRGVLELYNQQLRHFRGGVEWLGAASPTDTEFHRAIAAGDTKDPLAAMMLLDCRTYLPDDVLAKVDRASMAVSLESRVPFLDHRFVEFAWSLPTALKVRDGQTKWPLRQVLYRHVPRALIERPKMGFGVPVGNWLRGPLREWAFDLLFDRRLAGDGYLDESGLRKLWQLHIDGKGDWSFQLWNVLAFQAWRQERIHSFAAIRTAS